MSPSPSICNSFHVITSKYLSFPTLFLQHSKHHIFMWLQQELKAMTAARIAQTQTIEHQHYPHSHHPQYRQQPDIRGYASTANGVIQQHSLGSYQHQHHVNMGNNMDGSRNNHMSSNHVYGNSSLSHQMAGVGQFADSGPYATAMEMRRQAQNSPAFAGNPGGSTMRFNNHVCIDVSQALSIIFSDLSPHP